MTEEEKTVTEEEAPTTEEPSVAVEEGPEPVSEDVLARYEELFAGRFGDEDELFQEYLTKGSRVPPILDHYQVMRPRNPRYNPQSSIDMNLLVYDIHVQL